MYGAEKLSFVIKGRMTIPIQIICKEREKMSDEQRINYLKDLKFFVDHELRNCILKDRIRFRKEKRKRLRRFIRIMNLIVKESSAGSYYVDVPDHIEYENVRWDRPELAEMALRCLRKIIKDHKWVSVADLYYLAKKTSPSEEYDCYGWTDLSDARVYISYSDGRYGIKLPRPKMRIDANPKRRITNREIHK